MKSSQFHLSVHKSLPWHCHYIYSHINCWPDSSFCTSCAKTSCSCSQLCLHLPESASLSQWAHPGTSEENFHISILIGEDHYWEFIQDHGDGPTAIQSRLGYLLSGPLSLPQSIQTTSFHISVLSYTAEETEHNISGK